MRRLKPWQFGGLAAAVVAIIAAAYGVSTLSGGEAEPAVTEEMVNVAAEEQPISRDIQVSGRLVFPTRTELTFNTTGEVGQILVQNGDRVEEGQVLARLKALRISELEETVAQAKFDLDAAQDALESAKEEFINTPLEQAEFEEKIAKAQKEVDDARESLADFQRDYEITLATRMTAKVKAESALETALNQLGFYDRDQVNDLAAAVDKVAAKELALEAAREKLANFDADFEELLANARLTRVTAEEAFEKAKDNLNDFLRDPTRDTVNDKRIDVEILRRLEDKFEEARTNLKQAEDALADLQDDRLLKLQERRAAVTKAEADLVLAQDELQDIEDSVNQSLELRQRLAAVEEAKAKLAQAEIDLENEMDGPDPAVLAVREKALAVAREKLSDLTDGPDPLDVAIKEAKVAAAQAVLDEALEDLEGAVVRAPFSGIVFLVNAEVDDKVNDKSRVIEIIDATHLEVDGVVDAIDRPFISQGDTSKVSIASLPGRQLEGTVVRVADEPRTERGVVSYQVRIKVNLPDGLEVPARLSAVTSTITYNDIQR